MKKQSQKNIRNTVSNCVVKPVCFIFPEAKQWINKFINDWIIRNDNLLHFKHSFSCAHSIIHFNAHRANQNKNKKKQNTLDDFFTMALDGLIDMWFWRNFYAKKWINFNLKCEFSKYSLYFNFIRLHFNYTILLTLICSLWPVNCWCYFCRVDFYYRSESWIARFSDKHL